MSSRNKESASPSAKGKLSLFSSTSKTKSKSPLPSDASTSKGVTSKVAAMAAAVEEAAGTTVAALTNAKVAGKVGAKAKVGAVGRTASPPSDTLTDGAKPSSSKTEKGKKKFPNRYYDKVDGDKELNEKKKGMPKLSKAGVSSKSKSKAEVAAKTEVSEDKPVTDVLADQTPSDAPADQPASDTPVDQPASDTPADQPASDTLTDQPAPDVLTNQPASDVLIKQPASDVLKGKSKSEVSSEDQKEPATGSEGSKNLSAAASDCCYEDNLDDAADVAAHDAVDKAVTDKILETRQKTIKAQAVVRGHLARKHVAELKNQKGTAAAEEEAEAGAAEEVAEEVAEEASKEGAENSSEVVPEE